MAKKKKELVKELMKGDIFKPMSTIDVLGTKNDPCFGLNYDLTTKECKLCGDSELCAICFAQGLNKTREQLEKEQHFKDLDVLVDVPGVQKYMRGLKRKGSDKKEIIEKSMNKFELPKKDIREIYRSLIKKK